MQVIKINPGENNIEIQTSKIKEDVFITGSMGGNINLKLDIDTRGADINVYGVIIADKDKKYNINTVSNHIEPESKSRIHIKSIALDESNIIFKGLINIEKKAQLSDAYLKNDNLILSKDAHVESSPQLEIKADDVKASHGVTMANISDDDLYYIMSRGIEFKNARRLLIFGFINSLCEKITDSCSKNEILQLVDKL